MNDARISAKHPDNVFGHLFQGARSLDLASLLCTTRWPARRQLIQGNCKDEGAVNGSDEIYSVGESVQRWCPRERLHQDLRHPTTTR
ncbi:MAG: hypothetical protein MK538_12410 [Planctomycetes bacterium]|nr:hypothetical protein [Planctomycetota bacterium]